MYRVLLIDENANHAERLVARLRERGLAVQVVGLQQAARFLKQRIPVFDIVIFAVESTPECWLASLRSFVEASRQLSLAFGPLFLFASRQMCSSFARLRIERLGVRYAHG